MRETVLWITKITRCGATGYRLVTTANGETIHDKTDPSRDALLTWIRAAVRLARTTTRISHRIELCEARVKLV